MADRPTCTGAESPEIEVEITPDMIEAGMDALRGHFGSYDLRGTVEAILVAIGARASRGGFLLRK